MEESRLTPMATGYDPDLFNCLFKKTELLRKKLASEISHQRFGVDQEEILSWFNVKFIYVFNKYHKKDPDLLLGDLINSLKNFKCRILRKAYTVKFSQSIIRVGDTTVIENTQFYQPCYETTDDQEKLQLVKRFFRKNLSENAYEIFEIQMNPPYFFIHKFKRQEIPSLHKIPDLVMCEYLGLDSNEKTLKYIASLRKEIRDMVNYAKHLKERGIFFKSPTASLSLA